MLKFLLGLIGLGDPLTRIQSLSDGALSVFRRTLVKLKATEQKIAAHHTVQDEIIAEANKVKTALNNVTASNGKVIAKLEELLG